MLVSQSATPITSALPLIPPSDVEPYRGHQATAAARASLQRALDNYKTGRIALESTGADLSRTDSDTRSFGESHASELSSMVSTEGTISTEPGLPLTPPSQPATLPSTVMPVSYQLSDQSPPLNTAILNNSPAPIPISTSPTAAPIAVADPASPAPAMMPTVAETGIPVASGENGPGPASGSLHDIHGASSDAGPKSGGLPGRHSTGFDAGYGQPKFESAEEEKKRLQREDRERILAAQGPPAAGSTHSPGFESAEDEKKRLEREEREKILRSGGSNAGGPKDDEDLPPYQDL